MSSVELRREWEERVQAFRASGQNKTSWCAEQQIPVSRLGYWLRQFPLPEMQRTSPSNWAAIQLSDGPKEKGSLHVRIGAAVIEVNPGYNEALLGQLVQTLRCLG